jgi:hypothetical protein
MKSLRCGGIMDVVELMLFNVAVGSFEREA